MTYGFQGVWGRRRFTREHRCKGRGTSLQHASVAVTRESMPKIELVRAEILGRRCIHLLFCCIMYILTSSWSCVVHSSRNAMILALPASLYIGNLSRVFCTPSLSRDVAQFAREMRCSSPDTYVSTEPNSVASFRGNRTWSTNLSAEACGVVRRLYSDDTRLWSRLCAGEHGWGNHPTSESVGVV